MDATLCRDHLKQLLAEEAAALTSLEVLLDQEHELIIGDNIEALDRTGAERDTCISILMRIDAERLSLCSATGRATDKVGLLSLLGWCDKSGVLQQHWQDNTASIRHTRMLNDRNGTLVNNRLKRIEGKLDLLNGVQALQEKVYTARGSAYQQSSAGRVCNLQV